MFKRISLMLLLAVSVILLLLNGDGRGQTTDTSTDIQKIRAQIISLIEAGNITEAESETDKLLNDFSGDANLPRTLHSFTMRYEYAQRFQQAKRVYQQIAEKCPGSPYADRARLGIVREDVMYLIKSQDYEGAKQAIDKMVIDFAGHLDLPDTLYWVGERYEWEHRFEEANRIYQQVIQKYPDNQWADKARLGIARAEVMALINSQSYDQAGQALDKLIAGFAGNPDLPEAVYWIAERYKWSTRQEESSRLCRLIMQKYPESIWADKAKLGVSRMDLMALAEAQDYNQQAIDKLVADFAGHPDLPGTLYWIAEKYKWSFNFVQAKQCYQQIIQKFPNSPWADNARSGISSSDVTSTVISQDYNHPEETVDKLVSDFAGNPDLPRAILIAGEQCYKQGLAKKKEGLADEANKHYEKAMKIWNEFINKLPDSNMTPEMRAWVGDSCYELGRYDEATVYYKNACDSYYLFAPAARPDDTFLWHSLFMTGQSCQKLKESGGIPGSQADTQIIAAYEQLVRDFGGCPLAKDALRQLGRLYAGNNRWSDTARCLQAYLKIVPEERCPSEVFYDLARAYDQIGDSNSAKKTYSKFIRMVYPGDPRRTEAKARLVKLSEAD